MQLPLEKDDISILSDLGLTSNQIKVYLTLLRLSRPTRAISIFKSSGVTRQDVYRVLLELQNIGIVEKIISKPNEFAAVQPKKAVSILINKKKQSISDLNLKAKVFSRSASERYFKTSQVQENDKFVLITERGAIIHSIKENIEKTSRFFYSIAPKREFLPCLIILSESLKYLKNKGKKVKWITQSPSIEEGHKILSILAENPHIDVRIISENPSVKFALSDGKEIVLAVHEEGNFAETPALCTNSPSVISLAKNYFDACWKQGKRLENK